MDRKLQEEREQMAAELRSNMEVELERKLAEERQHANEERQHANAEADKRISQEVEKKMQEQFASFLTRMQQQQYLPNAKQAIGVRAIVLNFDYLLFSVMLSLSTCASIRVSNDLGADSPGPAYRVAYVSLAMSVALGFLGGSVMATARGIWGPLFSHNKWIINGVKKMMLLMELLKVVNFPLAICGGIVHGTARPWLGMYANISGFYLLTLLLSVVLAFKIHLGLTGLLTGFVVGVAFNSLVESGIYMCLVEN
ncbi:protein DETOXIFICATION 56-like [Nicotiana sylvestris]|uniref:MATE efflux family protein 9-like n=1 Tax=Nicotiana sylvestris TaxID=4096 RepID=A0A1U7YFL0_NICSY|nr:PREDICTED: MATE efflux family protein 9-like [Nicotiana sylvestris]